MAGGGGETRRVDVVGAGPQADMRQALGLVAASAAEANRARRPSPELFAELGERGLMRLLVPARSGGWELGPVAFFDLVEELAVVDGSTAWTFMTCNEEAGIVSAYLDPGDVDAFYAAAPATVVAGSGVPKGRATAGGSGWTIGGRWTFVSGCTASDHLVLASLVADAGPTRLCFAVVPTAAVEIDDTWHTAGLRGTGSNDVVADDVVVTSDRVGIVEPLAAAKPSSPYYRLPSSLRFPFPKVAVASGIARAAIAEFTQLASGKRPLFHKAELRHRPSAQQAAADAEAARSAGTAWVRAELFEVEELLTAGDAIEPERHARLRLACSHAVAGSIAAVEIVCREAGTTANFTDSPLAGFLSDVRAVAGHFTVAPYQTTTAGRVLLGLDPDDPNF